MSVPGTFVSPQTLLCATPPAPNARASGVDLTVWVDGIQASVNATTTTLSGGVGTNAMEFVYTPTSYNISSTSYNTTTTIANNTITTATSITATAAAAVVYPNLNPSSLSSLKVLDIGLRTTQTAASSPTGGTATGGGVQYLPPPHVALIIPSYGR